ncbi:MAG: hypothetical protein Q7T70_05875 [Polaromonas sp.]|nr:hypothetical protein [Polaromonas sp.]
MGITGFSLSPVLSFLLAPLQALVGFFSPPSAFQAPSRRAQTDFHPLSGRNEPAILAPVRPRTSPLTGASIARPACHNASRTTRQSRLRIVREFDVGVAPSCAGRMVISGRMADVCAELDRMVQQEAAGC